jgi:putative heme transporter
VRRLVQVLVFFLVLHYLLLPEIAGASKSLSVISHLNPLLVLAGVVAEAASLAAYAQLGRALIPYPDRPSLGALLRVQLATLGMSHVLPGGGAAATPLGFRLLRRAGVGAANASFVLSIQPIGSAAVLNVMLWVALVVSIPIRGANTAYVGVAIAGGIVLGSFGFLIFALARGSMYADRFVRSIANRLRFIDSDAVSKFLHDLAQRFHQLARDRKLMLRATGWAAAQWVADAASLWILLAALGVYMEPDGLLIAFALANVSASIPLTPGGVGVYEAVLTSALVGFGVGHVEAIIAVLAYRLFEFWLPIPIGLAAYISAQAHDPV